jgi:3-deoxy-7-phosphoheptulonate synthase
LAVDMLTKREKITRLVVDCSHKNAKGDYRNQALALKSIFAQRGEGNVNIAGGMLEVYLDPGKQQFRLRQDSRFTLSKGQSVTDACMGINDAEKLVGEIYASLA